MEGPDPREDSDYVAEETLKIVWNEEEFGLKGRVKVPPKFWYLLIAILCATLGVSYEEIMATVGI